MGPPKKKIKEAPPPPPPSLWRRLLFSPPLWIFVAALALRLIYFFIHKNDFWLRTPLLDDNLFNSWASVIEKEGLLARELGIFDFNPAYPYFLVILGKIIGRDVLTVAFFQHVAGSLVPVMFYWFCKNLFDRRAGFVAAVLSLAYGPSFYYESRLLGDFWIYFFNLGMLACLLFARQFASSLPKSIAGYFLAGLCLGFSTIFRPTNLVLAPLLFLWIGWQLWRDRKTLAAGLFLSGIGLWLPLLPFQIRNYIVDPNEGWGLTTSSGGVNFFLGNNPEANGLNASPSFVRYGPGKEYDDFRDEGERRAGRPLNRKEVSRFWASEAVRWFREHPGKAWRLVVLKAGYFWNYKEPTDNIFLSQFMRLTKMGGVRLLMWGWVVPLGLAGFLFSFFRRKDRSFWVMHGYLGIVFLVNVAFLILARYRFSALAALVPFAAYFLLLCYQMFVLKEREVKWGRTLLVICFLVGVGITRIPLIGEEDMVITNYSMGVIYANRGREEEAIKAYQAAVQEDPEFKAAHLNLGLLHLNRGELEKARTSLEILKTLETNPDQLRRIEETLQQL